MRIAVRILVALAALVAGLAVTSPAHAAGVVYLENRASTSWPVGAAESFVDTYTGTTMVFGTCRAGYRCVRVYERTISSSYAAITYNWSWGSQIYLNPQRRWYSWSAKRSIVAHELGHAFGLWGHNPYCTTVMYGRVFCPNGSVLPLRFSAGERTVLARW